MKICVFDIEGNDLNPDKIWCLVAAIFDGEKWVQKTTTDYDEMRKFFTNTDIIIGHNIIRWDMPVIKKLLGIGAKDMVIDTLALSWYLYPNREVHGLEMWGKYFGTPKPSIIDWNDPKLLPEYIHRCQEDVKINCKLWDKQLKDLKQLYGEDGGYMRLIKYLMFKLDCAQEAEENRWRLDTELCKEYIAELSIYKEEKIEELKAIMPNVKVYSELVKPKTLYKKDGKLSVRGIKWLDMLEAKDLPETYTEPVKYLSKEEEPNPNAHKQIKELLFGYGWKPVKFNKGVNGDIPQVRIDVGGVKVLCPSVVKLFKKAPKLEALDGLTVLTHRLGLLNGFMKNVDEEGFLMAAVGGLTNTLRFKHKVIVNLPKVKKTYGKMARGVLTASDSDHVLLGSDMSSLEDRTKQHYMWEFDPEYVKEMQDKDFCPHLSIAVKAKFMTEDEMKFFKWYKKNHS